MKLLCTGDLHINDWSAFSTLDEFGRPSRLLDYLKLAETISKLAKDQKCDAIILAGDISEAAVQKPMVHDIIGDFLRICSKNTPVHLIHGQHDIYTKSEKIDSKHSILREICKDLKEQNVHYYPEPTLIKLGPYSVYFQSWTHGHELEGPDADIFVGHGIVTGCTNLDGYIFMNGFDKEELMEKYRLSVIGDIHKRQEHVSEIYANRLVLQPGSPVQNNWKDHEDCGVYTVDINGPSEAISTEFYSIHDLAPKTFHRFTYDSPVESELVHSRPKVKLKKKDKNITKELEIKRDNTVIYETCSSLLEECSEIQNKELVKECLQEVFENTQLSSDKVIAKTKVLAVDIENFLSIEKASLSLDEFPRSCVITGPNGSGKTTLSEAIYWCLTGNTTKSIPITDIINVNNDIEYCSVIVKLTINNQEFSIKRERKAKTSSLTLFDKDNNPIKFSSIRETQAELYRLLGLQEWQLLMFSYFSAEKTNLFADLNDGSKNDLVGQIVGLDFVESMRLYSKDKKNSYKKQSLKLDGVISEKESVISQLEMKLKRLKAENIDNSSSIKAEITKLKNEISLTEEEKQENYTNFTNEYGDISEELDTSELSQNYYSLQSKLESTENKRVLLETNINKYKKQIKEAISGKCPTCKQDLHDKELLSHLKTQLSEEMKLFKSLPNTEKLTEELKTLHGELINSQKLSKALKKFNSEQRNYEDVLNKLPLKIAELEKDLLVQTTDNNAILEVEEELSNCTISMESTQKEIFNLNKLVKAWNYLDSTLFKRNGDLSKELNKQGSKLIQSCINEILIGLDIKINITKDLSLIGTFHNKAISYEGMSSGQKRLTDITIMVALNNLFSKIYNLEDGVLGLAVYDEILSFLDEKYIDYAKQIVDQSISRKILVITHDTKLMNMYESKIKVSINKSGSNYLKSWT